jgi:hypothetical protein
MTLAAWRGREHEASKLIEATSREATARGVGRMVNAATSASSVLHNGLGRHEAARDAAWQAFQRDQLGFGPFVVPELAEAASRTGGEAHVTAALDLVSVDARGVEAAADWDSLWSPENYLGYERSESFASPDGAVLDTPHVYAAPARLRLNHWALAGDWTVKRGATVLHQAEGQIVYRFHARDVHLVMAPPVRETPARFRVLLDGQPPGTGHGADVDDQGNGTVTEPRLYQLVRQPGPVTERTFEITFLDPGVQAYAFTFG